MIQKIGVLTSGGDSPGMNCAIRAVVRAGLSYGLEVYGIMDGYRGLVDDDMFLMNRSSVSDIVNRGGTILQTARLREFKEESVRQIAVNNLRKRGIDALVVIGGDGSYMGAKKLTEMGINCVGLPGTIDNDIASTDYTIGFDTCLNTIVECVDKIRDTTESHQRCAVIEVMGNHCGDLALFSGLAEGAEMIITPDHPIPEDEIIDSLKKLHDSKKKRAIVIVSEKMYPDIHAFAAKIGENTGFECRAEVLGRVQRGGAPSAFDRILAARMGAYAVDCLLDGKGGICVGLINNKIVDYDIYEALQLPRDKHVSMLRLIDILK
ncbi:MAG: 6-phosphofructokinase [Mollicutes bacterium]|nr:6-phosphofructokinase [Mollicutes bacterium]MCI7058491.1 6-phosphofructokinase [Mollicutes bacterium]MDD7715801.1 6-phosphofructokinase [Mollicutes bacterium]MDY3903681.1 6-phosphofructokinase [Candidatus Enteromonas sp.]MDY4936501.1 6-phosphofructokinase [Candidatus Enteromonas sp.]